MKKINNYLLILIFLLLSTSNSFANKIAYIDLDVVFKNSNEGKKIQTQLDSKKKDQLDKIKGEEIEIKQLEDEILPLGFVSDGTEEDIFIDSDGERWTVVGDYDFTNAI